MPCRDVVASVMAGVMLACSVTPRVGVPAVSPTRETHWYDVDVVEPGLAPAQPVPVSREELQRAVREMARSIRPRGAPAEEARQLLEAALEGEWLVEVYRGEVLTLVPLEEETSITPVDDDALRREYASYCEAQGGGDCLALLEDGPFLRVDDRRALALALALESVLGETLEALKRELLDPRTVLATVVWMAALYLMMWVPEPISKAVAAALTVLLVGWLGLDTVYGLWNGWAVLATQAHRARTFAELRAAGEQYAKVLGTRTARVLVMGIMAVAGGTAASLARQVRALPGYAQARLQAEAQGVRLAAIGEVEAVAVSSEGRLLAYMRARPGAGQAAAAAPRPGRPSILSVFRHRGGNQQVELANGQRWHLRKGMSPDDIPSADPVGDALQAAAKEMAGTWRSSDLTRGEAAALDGFLKAGDGLRAHLLLRRARGKWVEKALRLKFTHLKWSSRGVDAVDPATGRHYEILTGTDWNFAEHGRRLADVFFRMVYF